MKQAVRALKGAQFVRWSSRVLALALGSGILFMGAGNIRGYSALDSALFGATGVVLGLIAALSLGYALKGYQSEDDFDKAMASAVQQVESRTNSKKEEKK